MAVAEDATEGHEQNQRQTEMFEQLDQSARILNADGETTAKRRQRKGRVFEDDAAGLTKKIGLHRSEVRPLRQRRIDQHHGENRNGTPAPADVADQIECDVLAIYGGASKMCGANCKWAAYCGDAVVSNGEACDEGALNGAGYGHCTAACTLGPRCGDGIPQAASGEGCASARRVTG